VLFICACRVNSNALSVCIKSNSPSIADFSCAGKSSVDSILSLIPNDVRHAGQHFVSVLVLVASCKY